MHGKLVGLVFGSYTLPPFFIQAVQLNEIAAKFGDKLQFACIHIEEAHPSDGRQFEPNLDEYVIYDAGTAKDEHDALAKFVS